MTITYHNHYTTWSRDAILAEVKTKIKPSRYQHILRVEETALLLAEQYGADPEACSLAAILHDYAKDIDRETINELVEQGALDAEVMLYGSQIWHGPAGAYYAEHTFGITDKAILSAIRNHTIGHTEMTLVEKIIFVADYIEPGREFPGVFEARRLAAGSLDEAAMYKITQTLNHLVIKHRLVYPATLKVYNAWVRKREDERI